MKHFYTFHFVEWVMTWAVGLPAIAFAVSALRTQGVVSNRRRLMLCLLFAFVVTPIIIFDDEVGLNSPVLVDFFPAAEALAIGLFGRGGVPVINEIFIIGLALICLMAFLIFAFWWAIAVGRKREEPW